jgi:hypothetical protein
LRKEAFGPRREQRFQIADCRYLIADIKKKVQVVGKEDFGLRREQRFQIADGRYLIADIKKR